MNELLNELERKRIKMIERTQEPSVEEDRELIRNHVIKQYLRNVTQIVQINTVHEAVGISEERARKAIRDLIIDMEMLPVLGQGIIPRELITDGMECWDCEQD